MIALLRGGVLASVLGLLLGVTDRATAAFITSTYPPTAPLNAVLPLDPGQSAAGGFTMPTGVPYSLDSVTLRIGSGNAGSTARLELFGGTDVNPVGPALATFTSLVLPATFSDVTVTPTSPFLLLPDASYWIVLTETNLPGTLSLVSWAGNYPNFNIPTGIATNEGFRVGNSSPPTGDVGFQGVFRVEGTADLSSVPEPATIVQACIAGVFGLGWFWRRRRTVAR